MKIQAAVLAVALAAPIGAHAQAVTTARESINYEGAKRIVNACEALAQSKHWRLAIWVLDITGQPVYFANINDANEVGIRTAEMKARTALLSGAPSETRTATVSTPVGARVADSLDYFPVAGGIPLLKDGKVIGAVGAGGQPPENGQSLDQACAQAGIDAVFKK